jgi:phosphomannomutase
MAVALMLELMAREEKPVSEIIASVPRFYIIRESVKYNGNWNSVMDQIRNKLKNWTFDFTDGIKAIRDEDWVLVRPSGTEPIIRIFGQSESMERAFELADDIKSLIQSE